MLAGELFRAATWRFRISKDSREPGYCHPASATHAATPHDGDISKMTPKAERWRKAIQQLAARRRPAPPITPAELARLKAEFYTRSQEDDGKVSLDKSKGSSKGQTPIKG